MDVTNAKIKPNMAKATILISFLFLAYFQTNCMAQGIVSSDIYISNITKKEDKLVYSKPLNITNRKGYDNQPFFDSDSSLLFISIREGEQSDIYRYHTRTKKTSKQTQTTESEYSPRLSPDKKFISAVVVEKDSSQKLWLLNKDDFSFQSRLANDYDSVGYYCWINDSLMATIKITSPLSINILNYKTSDERRILLRVGRCIQSNSSGEVHFTRIMKNEHFLFKLFYPDFHPYQISEMPFESQDFYILPNNDIIASTGSHLMRLRHNAKEWEIETDFSAYGIKKIQRLAYSPSGDKVSFVVLNE
jgi:hypothetical protein